MFFEEFGSLLATLGIDTVDRLIICGDLNLPGTSPDKIDDDLAELVHSTSFAQLVNSPTQYTRQEHSNGVIKGLGSSTIARLGPLKRRRSISCTDGNRVNSGRGKSLIAGAIQRNCGGTSSLFFDRRKKSHQVLRSSLPRHSRTLSRRSWRAYGHQLHRLHPRFLITRHVSPVSFGSRPSIPP